MEGTPIRPNLKFHLNGNNCLRKVLSLGRRKENPTSSLINLGGPLDTRPFGSLFKEPKPGNPPRDARKVAQKEKFLPKAIILISLAPG